MEMRTSLVGLMEELKSGIHKIYDTVFENFHLMKNDLGELLKLNLEGLSKIDVDEKISIVKVNDLAVRSLGDAIESVSVKILSLQAPVGADLRRVLSSFRMIYDLMRISRDSLNAFRDILKVEITNIEFYHDQIHLVIDVLNNAKTILEKFVYVYDLEVHSNISLEPLVGEAIELDTKIDKIFEHNSAKVIDMVKNDKITVETGYAFLASFRSLERLGDHACNLVERVIYVYNADKIEIK